MNSIDFHSVMSGDDLHENLNELRESQPISWCEQGFWLLTRYDHCLSLIKRTGLFSQNVTSDITKMSGYDNLKPYGDGTPAEQWVLRKLLYTDPPVHPPLRKRVHDQFTRRSLEQHAGSLAREVCEETLAAIGDRDHFDVVKDFAVPYAVGVAARLLGFPRNDTPQIYEWLTEMDKVDNSPSMMTPDQVRVASAAITQLRDYIARTVASAEGASDRDPVLILGGGLPEDEAEALIDRALELLAGTGSMVGTVVTSFAALAAAPEQWSSLRAGSVSARLAVEELLRYTSVASSAYRIVVEPFTIDDTTFEPGSAVELELRAANRDPRVFTDPDSLQLDRDPNPHLVFGDGRHRCLGEHLVRVELQIAIEGLIGAFKSIATPNGGPVRIEDRFGILGYERLDAEVSREG